MKNERELTAAYKRFSEVERTYLEKFGKNSLDRVIFSDPVHPRIEDIDNDTATLKKAIKRNKPLEQVPKEIWDSMVF